MKLLVFVASFVSVVSAQPQFVWEGDVDGASVVHVRGDRVDVEDRQGAPVQRMRHRFVAPLPAVRQRVQIEVAQARGSVRIFAHPQPENNFTASVLIEDRMGGAGRYSFALYWATPDRRTAAPVPLRPRATRAGEESLTWSGRVDDEVIVECRARECRSQALRGGPASQERSIFTRPLPDAEVRVNLDDVQGRGDVQLIEQPSAGNGYLARVRIRDHSGGAGEYVFSLWWNPPRAGEPERLFSRPGVIWRGRVDGTIRIVVQENTAYAETVSGAAVANEAVTMLRALPRSAPNAAVKKLRGRGRAEVVELPSVRNGYRLLVEVNDSQGGADDYELEVGW